MYVADQNDLRAVLLYLGAPSEIAFKHRFRNHGGLLAVRRRTVRGLESEFVGTRQANCAGPYSRTR